MHQQTVMSLLTRKANDIPYEWLFKLEKVTIVMSKSKDRLLPKQGEELLKTLQTRFVENMNRHKGLEWAKVQAKLEANTEKLKSLNAMESTGGEPDVVGLFVRQAPSNNAGKITRQSTFE